VLSEWRGRNILANDVSRRYRLNDIAALEREIEFDV
jgi:hypothetical protein